MDKSEDIVAKLQKRIDYCEHNVQFFNHLLLHDSAVEWQIRMATFKEAKEIVESML